MYVINEEKVTRKRKKQRMTVIQIILFISSFERTKFLFRVNLIIKNNEKKTSHTK